MVFFEGGKDLEKPLATCASAVLLILLLQSLFGQRIGVLTVNLGALGFVVTLSNLIYMTFNWQTLTKGGNDLRALALTARHLTLPASFWCME